jgi:hypothetical protein
MMLVSGSSINSYCTDSIFVYVRPAALTDEYTGGYDRYMNHSSLLLSLPRELIYNIAAADAGVYNTILRLCRYTIGLFPLSRRLDFMIGFGVALWLKNGSGIVGLIWSWNGLLHIIYGPSILWPEGYFTYHWHGDYHRRGGPALYCSTGMEWYERGCNHRELMEPAGTGVAWLRGVAHISYHGDSGMYLIWCCLGRRIRARTVTGALADEARAEMAYWAARG